MAAVRPMPLRIATGRGDQNGQGGEYAAGCKSLRAHLGGKIDRFRGVDARIDSLFF